jgi:hypothetical protein
LQIKSPTAVEDPLQGLVELQLLDGVRIALLGLAIKTVEQRHAAADLRKREQA